LWPHNWYNIINIYYLNANPSPHPQLHPSNDTMLGDIQISKGSTNVYIWQIWNFLSSMTAGCSGNPRHKVVNEESKIGSFINLLTLYDKSWVLNNILSPYHELSIAYMRWIKLIYLLQNICLRPCLKTNLTDWWNPNSEWRWPVPIIQCNNFPNKS